ncbi:MAG: hypothetical protein EOP32_00340 [Rhodococcus sp. (in: high G+C Gram-positive bacteria)]|nr:MAG: hypothetical protein EOP32_00340 [Rhodococcus sp. (in: high G+C Gram-positive bacteria)]
MREQVVWRTAQPLWADGLSAGVGFERPALLRFAADDFMEQFAAAVRPGGAGLGPLVAGHESWQRPGAGLGTIHERGPATPVPLFQPVHGRFYLVTASLVCRRYGHPDHATFPDRDESVSFVLRRLVASGSVALDPTDPSTFVEHAWIPAGDGGVWRPAPPGAPLADEARLPLFPITTAGRDGGPRRLLAGLVPVSRREIYEPVPIVAPADTSPSIDPLAALADTRLRVLETVVAGMQQVLAADAAADAALVRESLFFTMVDLALWLDGPAGFLEGSLATGSTVLPELDRRFGATTTWRRALATAMTGETALFEQGRAEPAPVAGLTPSALRAAIRRLGIEAFSPGGPTFFPTQTTFFLHASKILPPRAFPSTGGAAALPAGPAVYAARCLYERPRCARAERHKLSTPSRAFQLAPFYDPDAPARPVRIVMPVDTSPGGLRKFPRSVSMVLSAELRKQMARVSEETLRDGTVGTAPAVGFGMVCQLSVPIIAICALMLLMIIVAVLNIVFFWVPLLKVCAPVPKEG